MKKVTLVSILASLALVLFLSMGSWAQRMGESGMQQGMMGATASGQQSAVQPYGTPGYGMGSGMMGGGMMGMNPGMMGGGMMGVGSGMMGMNPSMMGGMGRQDFLGLLKESLDLTDEQLTTIRSTIAESRRGIIRKTAEIKIAELDLREMLRSTDTDMAAVKDKLKEIEGLRTELRLARIEKHEKVKEALTPEQLEKFLDSYPWHMGNMGSGAMHHQHE